MSTEKKTIGNKTLADVRKFIAFRRVGYREIPAELKKLFGDSLGLKEAFVFVRRDGNFHAILFFTDSKALEDARLNGSIPCVEVAVYEALERHGRGKRGDFEVSFEYDTDKNVSREFNGNYWNRLR